MVTYLECNIGWNQLLYSEKFNENQQSTGDPSYISTLGAIIYKAMSVVDKDTT